ncbi:MAG: hypothetical protein U0002_18275 [Thermoanaerobaculia bacterium]
MRRGLTRALAVAFLVLATAGSVQAGTVYVPLAKDVVIDGIRYQTQIWVSNKGDVPRRFGALFLPNDTDGTSRPDGNPAPNIGINGGATLQLTGIAPANSVGMLEISGAPQILVTAKLVSTVNGVEHIGTALPVISSDNLIAAGTQINLQNFDRSTTRRTDFLLVNLAQTAASCNVALFRADGTSIGDPAVVTLLPLSHREYGDVLNALGEANIAAARLVATCDKTYFAYALNYDRATGDATVQLPSQDLDSALTRPGDNPPPPPPPPNDCDPAAVACFQKTGVFYEPNPGETRRRESFQIASGSYSKTHMRVEVYHGGWLRPPSGLHSLFWYALGGRHYRLIGFAGALGPGKDQLLFRHGINLPAGDKPKFTPSFNFVPGTTYVLDYVWNPAGRTLSFKVMDTSGNVLIEITDRPNANRMNIEQGEDLTLDFSSELGANPNEPPTYGWRYQNLLVEVFP